MNGERAMLLRRSGRWSVVPAISSLALVGTLAAATPPAAGPSTSSAGSAHVIATISLGRQLAYNVATDPVSHMVYVGSGREQLTEPS